MIVNDHDDDNDDVKGNDQGITMTLPTNNFLSLEGNDTTKMRDPNLLVALWSRGAI